MIQGQLRVYRYLGCANSNKQRIKTQGQLEP